MARTISTYVRSGVLPWAGQMLHIKKAVIDMTAETGTLAADTIQCLTVPAYTQVIDVMVRIITPAVVGTALTGGMGDGGSTAGWDAANDVDLEASAGTLTRSTKGTDARNVANVFAYEYTSEDTIDLLVGTVTGTITSGAKFEVLAICLNTIAGLE